MRPATWTICLLTSALAVLVGCNNNPFYPGYSARRVAPGPAPGAAPLAAPRAGYATDLQNLTRRASDLNANNRDLHTELAQANQQNQIMLDQTRLLQKRLTDSAGLLQQTQEKLVAADQRIATLQEERVRRGGAMITANRSSRSALRKIDLPGFEVREEDDVIRIELPTDRIFQRDSAQLLPTAYGLIDTAAQAIARYYPRQVIGIEGHTDTAANFGLGQMSKHQFAALQATTVMQQFTARNQLPARQFFVLSHGANRPRASNGTPAGRARNRRVELVIYPDAYDRR